MPGTREIKDYVPADEGWGVVIGRLAQPASPDQNDEPVATADEPDSEADKRMSEQNSHPSKPEQEQPKKRGVLVHGDAGGYKPRNRIRREFRLVG
jgi:hypothetical protein